MFRRAFVGALLALPFLRGAFFPKPPAPGPKSMPGCSGRGVRMKISVVRAKRLSGGFHEARVYGAKGRFLYGRIAHGMFNASKLKQLQGRELYLDEISLALDGCFG